MSFNPTSSSFLINKFLISLNLMENLNVNKMMNFTNLLGSATKVPMLILEYYDKWVYRMEDYLNGIDEEIWRSI